MIKKLFACCLCLPAAMSFVTMTGNALGNTIIQSDTKVVIIISSLPSPTEQFAAEELQSYLNQIVGVNASLSPDLPGSDAVMFAVGKTPYSKSYQDKFDKSLISTGPDSFVIHAQDNRVVLTGGSDRATLYSIYELLRQQGCRWFFPGPDGQVIPQKKTLVIQNGQTTFVPDFVQRSIDISPIEGIPTQDMVDWAVKNRLNYLFALRPERIVRMLPADQQDVWSKRGGQLQWEWIAHNFSHMLPNDTYYAEHPEYYSLYKGERLMLSGKAIGGGNLCTTNPDVIKLCAQYAIDWFDKNPRGQVVPLWPADGVVKWCECDNCRHLGGRNFMSGQEGSMSRRLVTFANAVARLVAQKYSDRYLLCPAYSNYIEPVPDIPLEKNVLVQYCLHGCYAHGLDRCNPNGEEKRRLDAWAQAAPGRFGVWEYFLLGDHINDPGKITPAFLPVTCRARDTIRYLKSVGANFYFTQSSPKYWKHNPLPYYIIPQLLWNTEADFDELFDEFFEKMYGPAAAPLAKFYRLIEDTTEKAQWHPQIYSDIAAPSAKVFSPEILAQLQEFLTDAESQQLTPVQRTRLELVRQAFDYTKVNADTQSLSGLDADTPWRIIRAQDHYVINADGQEISDKRYAERIMNAKDTGSYTADFERILFRARKRTVPILFLENEQIKVAVIPGIGGRIIRLIDKQTGRNFMAESDGKDALDSVGEAYFHYGGYEEYIGDKFGDPGWEKEFSCRTFQNHNRSGIVLTLEIPGCLLKRTISVPKPNGPEVYISSVLTNTARSAQKIKLRVHPAMTLGDNCGDHAVYLRKPDGRFEKSLLDRENNSISLQPQGIWAIVNPDENVGIVNYFHPQAALTYLCKTAPDRFNMELMGHEQTLGYRESLTINHVYRLIGDAQTQLDEALAVDYQTKLAVFAENQPSPLTLEPGLGTVDFVRGKAGLAGSFDGQQALTFDSQYLKAHAGTLEMWVQMPQALKEFENQFVIGVGDNSPEWFVIALGSGKVTFLTKKKGPHTYLDVGEYYLNLSVDVGDWQANQWRHLAFVWANAGDQKGLVQIYIDGQLKDERYNALLGQSFDYPTMMVGGSVLGRDKFFIGHLDELRISNYPKTAREIIADFQNVAAGHALSAQEGTLLLLGFENNCNAVSRTAEPIDNALIQDKVQEIFNSSK